jgi:ketosteroid isomerase-like protein
LTCSPSLIASRSRRCRGQFNDAVMMRDYDRVAWLFTEDGALRMPNIPVELAGRDEIRA